MDEQNFNSTLSGRISPTPPSGIGQALAPFNLKELFRRTWEIYKSRFWAFLGIIVIAAAITTILSTAILLIGGFSIKGLFSSVLYGNLTLYFFAFLIILIFLLVAYGWVFMSLIYATQITDEKRKFTECLKLGWFKILSFIWIDLLIWICIFGWNILLTFFGAFLMIRFSLPLLLFYIITLVLFVPSIFFLTWFILGFYVLAAENLKGTKALARSKELMKGYGWRVFASIFLIWTATLLLQWLIGLIPHVGDYLVLLLSFFYFPFLITFLSVLYKNLSDAKKDRPITASRKKIAIIIIVSLLLIPLSIFAVYKLFIGGIIQKHLREAVPIESGAYEQYGLIVSQVSGISEFPKTQKPEVKLFVTSFCPYGHIFESIISPIADSWGDKIDIELHYVIYEDFSTGYPDYCIDKENNYCSVHGAEEVKQDIRELCIQKYQRDKLWYFVRTINNHATPENVESMWAINAQVQGIDVNRIRNCQEREGEELLNQELEILQKRHLVQDPSKHNGDRDIIISSSPVLVINGIVYDGERMDDDVKAAVCSSFESPPEECK